MYVLRTYVSMPVYVCIMCVYMYVCMCVCTIYFVSLNTSKVSSLKWCYWRYVILCM